ncbi:MULTISPECIES: IclR family transcriptional regulator [Methylobacterium]|uniref:HTH-type transcriptional regulator TsaQ1/TsaQ2 n=1 Tax=Methylobacterium hispanicum TaxID=270350 RepID=A0AAV4ZFI4_9HYPH|nr:MULTISPECIES: IclR family transcriptional regulator [Methylobacterium]GJD86889.1 HTH-type transcriptional regulator TsaQ1/TsaQ2 [Methylobacterium hispanicum]
MSETALDPLADPEAEEGAGPKEDRHFVTALARGLAVLACFGRDRRMLANHDIAEACGLPRSTVSRLTYTLTKLGYLHLVEESGKYRLGTQTIALGSMALGGLDVRQIARPALRAVAQAANASVGLGVRDRLSMRYIDCQRGPAAISLNLDTGSRISLARSAMGRAYIAVCSDRERAALYEELQAYDPLAWPALRAGLDRAVQEHREIGCCTSFGEWQDTVSAIAVGFRPGGGLPPMSVNCGAPTIITDGRFLMDVARPKLIEAVRGLEGVMGA